MSQFERTTLAERERAKPPNRSPITGLLHSPNRKSNTGIFLDQKGN